tara:strand:- start:3784 stop:4581 length:798 start_codon:yes stop_codon:yes gene_type:complete
MLKPLALDVTLFNVAEGITSYIEAAIARGLPEFRPALCTNDGTFVVVGSGPSLASFADELRAERAKGRPICAAKGAHDWLCEQGIEPDLFVSIEPRDRRNNLKHKTERTIYLLASRVAPEIFDHVMENAPGRVFIWHAASKEEENEILRKHKIKVAIGGMSTSGLRSVNIGYFMGFRKFVFYGMDSCNAPDGVTKRIDGSLTGSTIDVLVGGAQGRKFTCNVAMAKQAEDFQFLYVSMPDITIDVKGDGLIAAIVDERRKAGKIA